MSPSLIGPRLLLGALLLGGGQAIAAPEQQQQRPPEPTPQTAQRGTTDAQPPRERRWACPPTSLLYLAQLGVGGTTAAGGPRYLVLDVRQGLLCVRNRDGDLRSEGLRLVPELGYHYLRPRPEDERPAAAAHLASLGLGVGFGNRWLSLGGVGRLLVGTEEGALALGLRHGLLLRGLYDSVTIEASHLALHLPGGWRNELYGGLSVNVLLLALAYYRR